MGAPAFSSSPSLRPHAQPAALADQRPPGLPIGPRPTPPPALPRTPIWGPIACFLDMAEQQETPVVIAGAGPGGLTAAYLLTKQGQHPVVLEADDVVGGISRTVVRDGWRFDLGGHRFFTKVDEVEALWHEILPEGDFMLRPRMSRIYYKGKYLDYPLRAMNVLRNIAPWEGILIVFSYMWSRIRPPKDESNYENWLVKRFGWRLYRTFFKTYTEKVWGVPVAEMPADWGGQRGRELD